MNIERNFWKQGPLPFDEAQDRLAGLLCDSLMIKGEHHLTLQPQPCTY
ncbi:MAG: hypothetical protein HS100_03295 [Anaerolineales bacterium]|nr:hypothetical protein [Anaerolineales bacterium]